MNDKKAKRLRRLARELAALAGTGWYEGLVVASHKNHSTARLAPSGKAVYRELKKGA